MKFTCDSCGAQYMIGDDKLGKRGVKVRCKKCSYVIIVRPPGYAAEKKPTNVFTDQETKTDLEMGRESVLGAPRPPAFENDMDEPLTRLLGQSAPERDGPQTYAGDIRDEELSLDPGPKPGLLRELASMNAPDEDRDEVATAAFPVLTQSPVHEVSRIEAPVSDFSSPFSIGEVPRSPLDVRSIPSLRLGEPDGDELTSVDSLSPFTPKDGAPPRAFAQGDDDDEAPAGEAFGGADLGRGDPPAEGFDEPPPEAEEARTRRITHEALRAEAHREPLGFDDSLVSAKISAMDKNELVDMQSSLNDSLAQDSWGARVDASHADPASEPRAAKSNSMAALSRLAAAQEDHGENGSKPAAVPAYGGSAAVAASLARLGIAHDEPVPQIEAPLDFELTNAFDQMFGAAAEEAEISAGFAGESDPAPNEVFRSAYGDPGDRKQTRVFDLEAMKQVEAEQDIAHRETNGHAHTTLPQSPASSGPSAKAVDGHEWYVAINDEQIGPMSFGDLRTRWESGDVGPSSLCWRVGMPDWTTVREVKELEGLGDMDERVRTVIAKVEAPTEDTDEVAARTPHSIAMPPEDEEVTKAPKPRAAPAQTVEEPSWRPSAASALASLAAQELDSIDDKAKKGDDVVGRALPSTSDALEKLLAGAGGDDTAPGASPFGSAEHSSSKIRPLPKGTDVASSVSLRDPVMSRPKSNLIPVAILGGFLFLGVVILAVALRSPHPDPVAVQPSDPQRVEKVAPAPTPPPEPQGQVAPQAVPPSGASGTDAPGAPGDAPGAPGTGAPGTGAPGAGTPPSGALATGSSGAAGAPSEAVKVPSSDTLAARTAEPPPSQAEAPPDDGRRAGTKRTAREGGGREGGSRTREARESREDARDSRASGDRDRKKDPEPEASAGSAEEELLGTRKRRMVEEAPSSELPKQLEDSDILGELRRNKASIQACRQKQQQADPALEGTLTINFVIEGSGRTKHWEVEPAKFKSSVVGKCVVEAVKKWNFPRFSGRPMPVDFPVRVGGG